MSTQRNLQTLQNLYDAFGRGDVPTILELCSPEVEWEFGTSEASRRIPWFAPGTGREAVVRFFHALNEHLTFEEFTIHTMMAEGDWAVALARVVCVHKATGRRFVEAFEPHVWRFDEHGRVRAMRHAADTLQQAEAAGLVTWTA